MTPLVIFLSAHQWGQGAVAMTASEALGTLAIGLRSWSSCQCEDFKWSGNRKPCLQDHTPVEELKTQIRGKRSQSRRVCEASLKSRGRAVEGLPVCPGEGRPGGEAGGSRSQVRDPRARGRTCWPDSGRQKVLRPHCCCHGVAQSCPTLYNPTDCSPTRLFHPQDFPGKNTGLGCHPLLQGIFLT